MLRKLIISTALLASCLAAAPVFSQTLTREQVVMDRDMFLKIFRWDELNSQWVMKDGMAVPTGVKSRAEVMAMTEEFLKMNRWDDVNSEWVPTGGKPRDMSKLTRDQVQMETIRFLMTHRFDEAASEWVSKMRAR